jgi:hypothetical protein
MDLLKNLNKNKEKRLFCKSFNFALHNKQKNRMNSLIFRVLVLLYTIHKLAECEQSENVDYRLRNEELDAYYNHLKKYGLYYRRDITLLDETQFFKKIKSLLGHGFDKVVYDCADPSYNKYPTIYPTKYIHSTRFIDNEQVRLNSQQLKDLKESAKCDSKTKVWYFEKPLQLATLDLRSKTISKSSVPYDSLFLIFDMLKQETCKEFMRLIGYPSDGGCKYIQPEELDSSHYHGENQKPSSSTNSYKPSSTRATSYYTEYR